MKKTFKGILALVLALVMVFVMAGCSLRKETPAEKYADIIEDFVPDWNNVEELCVGDVHKADGAIWTEVNFMDMVKTASTDESVVTVSKGGKVTAVGEGSAYVIIAVEFPVLGVMMHEITRYDVVSPEVQAQEKAFVMAIDMQMKVGETEETAEAAWLHFPGDASGKSSDESVVTVSNDFAITAVGVGQAYVTFESGMGLTRTYLITVSN